MAEKTLVLFGAATIPLGVAMNSTKGGWKTTIAANAAQMGKKIDGVSIKELAEGAGIKTITIEKAADVTPAVLNADPATALFISAGSPWIFNNEILARFNNRVINLHGTRLPKDRGGTLYSWQILTGAKTGMCLLHQMTAGIDDGPILAWEDFIYPAWCRLPKDYSQVYEQKNTEFISRFVANYNGNLTPQVQPEYLSTYWPRLRADVHGWVDWNWDFVEIERLICAFDEPYGGARCRFQGKTVVLRNAWAQSTDGYTHPFQQGLVYRNNGRWINVAVKGGELLICSVKDEEGNDILPLIKPGDRLYTNPEDLMQTKKRVVKSSKGLIVQPEK